MCKIIRKSKRTSFKGYKVALKLNGEYYSIYTGIKYSIGPVQGIRVDYSTKHPLQPSHNIREQMLLNPDMYGRTAVLLNLNTAKGLLRPLLKEFWWLKGWTFVIVEMTLSDDLMNGRFGSDFPVVIGKNIVSIKEV